MIWVLEWIVLSRLVVVAICWSTTETHSVYKLQPNSKGEVENVSVPLATGRNSALLLVFKSHSSLFKKQTSFYISAKAPPYSGYKVSAVIEEMTLRMIDRGDDQKFLPEADESSCADYLEVLSQSLPPGKMCGSWKLRKEDRVIQQGIHQNVIGNCQLRAGGNYQECHPPTQLDLRVVISGGDNVYVKPSNISFTITVTAFRHAGSGSGSCSKDELLCKDDTAPRCIWSGLRCDDHLNCGLMQRYDDEFNCKGHKKDVWEPYRRELSFFDISLYSLVLLAMIGAFAVLYYWQKQIKKLLGIEIHALPVPTSDDGPRFLNSVASGEAGRPAATAISLLFIPRSSDCRDGAPKTTDMPPSYSSLFPDGPPTEAQSSSQQPAEECYPYESVATDTTTPAAT